MKKISSILASLFFTAMAFSQTQPSVTISTTGNRNKQVIVDGNYYTIKNTTSTEVSTIVITDIAIGTHSLKLVRLNPYNKTVSTTSSFILRQGYDLAIAISSTGSISSSEKWIVNQVKDPVSQISVAAFNKLLAQTRKKTSSTARAAFLENEFNNTSRMMKAKQASQLIQLVNSENLRLKLAKQSYLLVSDPENFDLVSKLINSTSKRNELDDYIAALPGKETGDEADDHSPMNNTNFQIVYNELKAEPSVSDKTYYLTNFFGQEFNYYSSSQAKQLIELINGEQERLSLTKSAYRGITDKENYSIVYPLLNNSYDKADLIAYINNYNNNNSDTPGSAMSDADFNRLYQSVLYKSSANRYAAINTAFTTTGNYFSVTQAKKLIPLVTDEANRLQLAKTVYIVLTDRTNYTQFYEFLNSNYSRIELDNYVNNYNNGNTGNQAAMSDVNFNSLYQSVLYKSSANRYAAINTAFTTTGNYFTVAQAKKLIPLVTDEANRLQLAKTVYIVLTDRTNYTQFYEFLNSNYSRIELDNYVNNYNNSNAGNQVAMSDVNFNSLYQSVLYKSSASRYAAINTAFTTAGNYFTVAQAKKLIPLVTDEANRLQLAKTVYKVLVDGSNYTQFYEFLNSNYSRIELDNYVNNYNNGNTGNQVAMSDIEFNTLYNKVTNAWTNSSRFNLVADAFRINTNYFTTYQVRQLLVLISSETDKLSLAKNSYDNVVDLNNFTNLYDLFTTSSYRNDLAAYVASMQNGIDPTVKIAMSETEFNAIYRDLQLTFGIGARYSTLTELFSKETNYFSVAQARQLIQMVTLESNRLELAKLSYNNISDPANFNQLYDIFSSQASKDELTAFVNNANNQ